MHCGDTVRSHRTVSACCLGSVPHVNWQTCCSTLSAWTSPFCPSVGPLIVLSLWNAAEPLSTAHRRDNGPLGAGMTLASEPSSQTGTGRELQLRLQELLDPEPPKPPHERTERTSGSLPTTYDLSVIPKFPAQPPAWAEGGFTESPVASLKSPSMTQVTQSLSALSLCESH